MTATAPARPGGLVGLAHRARNLLASVANLDKLAIWLVLFAGVITIIKKNYTPDDPLSYAMWFGIALGIAALFYEMSGAKRLANAWFHAKPGALVASIFIWALAFGFSVNQWIGAASESQAEKTNTHKAAFVASETRTASVKDAEAKLERLRGERNLMKPKASVAAARATIQTSEAHKFFRSTDGCKETRGPQTRAFCDAYASAIADVSLWDQIARQEMALGEAEGELAEARKAALETPIETSTTRQDLVILTRYAGMTEEGAQIFNGLAAIIAISIFLSFGSMRAELDRLNATGQRKRFHFWLALRRWYSWIVNGTEPEHISISIEDAAGRELKQGFAKAFEEIDRRRLAAA